MPLATPPAPSAARVEALAAHVEKLAAHVDATQELIDQFSGLALYLGAADFEGYALRSHLAQSKRWLAEYRSRLAAERAGLEGAP